MTPSIETWSVTSGWQYRVTFDDRIIGGWAVTEDAAEQKATEVASR